MAIIYKVRDLRPNEISVTREIKLDPIVLIEIERSFAQYLEKLHEEKPVPGAWLYCLELNVKLKADVVMDGESEFALAIGGDDVPDK